MKQVTIRSLSLQNFKGISQMDMSFEKSHNIVAAKNGAGKTTLMYAWLWVLGLDVPDVIPKIDNQELHNLETKVTAVVRMAEYDFTLCRTQTEEWKTNRATGKEEKHTNKCTYAIDGIEFTYTVYKEKLATYFGLTYDRIEVLTNKDYFNTDKPPKWTWTSRRKELFELTGAANLVQGLAEKSDYELIADDLRKDFSATDIRKTKMKALQGISAEKDRNITLIEDKQNDIAKYGAIDFAALEAQKAGYEQQLTELNLSIAKADDSTAKAQIRAQINALVTEQTQLKIADNNKKAQLKNTADSYAIQKRRIQNQAEALKATVTDVASYEKRIAELQALAWSGDTKCPTCGQALPQEKIAAAQEQFTKAKEADIHEYQEKIETAKVANAEINGKLDELRKQYIALNSDESLAIAELDNFEPNSRIAALEGEIAALKAQLSETPTNTDVSTQAQIAAVKGRISEIQSQLAYKQVVADLKERVAGLKVANVELTDKEMVLKAAIQQIDAYVSEQVRLVTDTINGLFDGGVSFALFSENYAGAESELKETCVCMYNGKVYSSLSTGERFIANLKVTQALQRAYGVSLPLFCDNAECCTNGVSGEQQLIMLQAASHRELENCIRVQKG
ncbi:MAG: hypothetical protein HFE46_07130 [Clostridia bacterium]|nr:hypothetical protein [Clostridia bacterium]